MKIKTVLVFSLIFTLLLHSLGIQETFSASEEKDYIIRLKKDVDIDSFIEKKEMKNKKLKKLNTSQKILISTLKHNEVIELQNLSEIEFVEEDALVEITSIGKVDKDHTKVKKMNKVDQTMPWGMKAIGVDQALDQKLDGKHIKVAIIDTGISKHKDLKIAGGESFVEGITSYYDDNGHGTHVAGTIAALSNKIGVVGSASKSDIYAVKVLNNAGSGTVSQVIQGIEWAIENQMNIISMSLGSSINSEALHAAIIDAHNKGILVFAAAGNRGIGENTMLYPANYPEVISVGATNESHKRENFSSTGPSLDLVAPGVEILSTTSAGNYGVLSGTSMATPHVAGAAATIWSKNGSLTNEEVKDILLQTATPLGNQNEYGHGIINLAKALSIIDSSIPTPNPDSENPSLPNEPTEPFDIKKFDRTILTLDKQLKALMEQALLANDITLGKEIEKNRNELIVRNAALHRISQENTTLSKNDMDAETLMNDYYNSNYSSFMSIQSMYEELINLYSSNSQSISGQSFEIAAYDYVGHLQIINPGQSATVSLKLREPKEYVWIDVLDPSGSRIEGTTRRSQLANTDIPYKWTTSSSTPIGDYTIKYTYLETGLEDYFTIYVRQGVPDTPTGLKTNTYSNSVTLSWDPVNGATSYSLQRDGVTVNTNTGSNSYTFTGLSPRTPYTLGVAANNSSGTSSYAVTRIETEPEDYPDTPTGLTTSSKANSITLSWNPAGGANSYTLQRDGVTVATTSKTSYTFTGLKSNTPYTLGVASLNTTGSSSYATKNASTTIEIPSPTNLSTSLTDNSISLSWTAVSGATSYTLKRDGLTVGVTSDTSYTFTGLSPDTRYNLGVATTTSNGTSPFATTSAVTLPEVLTLYNPVDVSLPSGNSKIYSFMAPTTENYKIFTGPFGGTGGLNDTVLELYSDADLSDEIAFNDDGDDGVFSEINIALDAGTTYYVRLRTVFSNQAVNARLTVTLDTQDISSLNLNVPVDVSLPKGAQQIYKFTPTTTESFKIFTGPFGEIGGSNDTVLELYSDSDLSDEIGFNDDATWETRFSEINITLYAGETYYVKLKHYSTTQSVHTRLTVTTDIPPASSLVLDVPVDVTVGPNEFKVFKFTPTKGGLYKFSTSFLTSNSDPYLHLYDDPNLRTQIAYNDDANGISYSEIQIELKAGKDYFVKFRGYNNTSANARLIVTNIPTIFQNLSTDTSVDITNSNRNNAYYKFTPNSTGFYKFATNSYQNNGMSADTEIFIYTDIEMTNLLIHNNNTLQPTSNFARLYKELNAGQTYYIKVGGFNNSTVNFRFTLTHSPDSDLDKIPDELEINGIRLAYKGNFVTTVYTDPYNSDTDSNGVYDGVEILELRYYNSTGDFYEAIDNPYEIEDGTLVNGLKLNIPANLSSETTDVTTLKSLLETTENYKKLVLDYQTYLDSYLTSLSDVGRDNLDYYVSQVITSGLGYYSLSESIVNRIESLGTVSDIQWLDEKSPNIEYLSYRNGFYVENNVNAQSGFFFANVGTEVHNKITELFKKDKGDLYSKFSNNKIPVPGTNLRPDLVEDSTRHYEEYAKKNDGYANIWEIKPISYYVTPYQNIVAIDQLDSYVDKYKIAFPNKIVDKGSLQDWKRNWETVYIEKYKLYAHFFQTGTEKNKGMVYYALVKSPNTTHVDTYFKKKVEEEKVKSNLEGGTVVEIIGSHKKYPDKLVAYAMIGGAAVIIVGALVNNIFIVGVADDAIAATIASQMIRNAIIILRQRGIQVAV
jgi:hypothetical protein